MTPALRSRLIRSENTQEPTILPSTGATSLGGGKQSLHEESSAAGQSDALEKGIALCAATSRRGLYQRRFRLQERRIRLRGRGCASRQQNPARRIWLSHHGVALPASRGLCRKSRP